MARGTWEAGLCSAGCDSANGGAEVCCYACFCPLCAGSQVLGSLPHSARLRDGSSVPCAGTCVGACALTLVPFVGHLVFCYSLSKARCYVRERSGMPRDDDLDALATVCCYPCSVCQDQVQINARALRTSREAELGTRVHAVAPMRW